MKTGTILLVLVAASCTSDGGTAGDAGEFDSATSSDATNHQTDASLDCLDPDHDGYGDGPECLGPDCAPDDPERHPGREELCDTVDNNCADGIDELEECALPRLWVFVLAGQSNMVGLGVSSQLPAGDATLVANTFIYYNDSIHTNPNAEQWLALGPGFGVTSDHFGLELKFGRQLQSHWPGRAVALIKVAEGGTALYDRWDAPNGDLYQLLLSELEVQLAALAEVWRPQVMGFVWMQGESDGISQSDALAYHGNLTDLMTSLRAELGVEVLPLTAGLIAIQDLWPYADIVRAATSLVAQEQGQMEVVETTDLPRHADDPAHYDTQGNLALGQRFADAMVSLLPTEFHFAADFGAAQGDRFWLYRDRHDDMTTAMSYDPIEERWQGSESVQLIGAGWMHPGENRDAELVWWAPYAGLAEVQVSVAAADSGGGDGTWVEIARDDTVIWGPVAIPNGASEQHTFQRFVLQGQKLQFRTSSGPAHDASYDTTSWQIDIDMSNVDE